MVQKKFIASIFTFAFLILSLALTSAATTNVNSPAQDSTIKGFDGLVFNFSVTDNTTIGTCTLHYNENTISNTSVLDEGANYFTLNDLEKTKYDWTLACENVANKTGSFFVIDSNDEKNFCGDDLNSSEVEITDISDKSTSTEGDWEWKPLDDITIEVDIENYDEDDDHEYEVKLVFLDGDGNDVSNDVADDDDDLVDDDVDVDEDDDATVTFNFQVDGEVLDDNYELYAIAERSGHCSFLKLEDDVDISKDSHDVVVQEVAGPNTVEAGDTAQYEVEIANIGSNDEDQVKIIAYNSEMGIKIEKEIEDLDEGDTETLTFSIKFPAEVTEDLYKIRFSTEFDYDDDDEVYEEESATEDDILYAVTVLGNPVVTSPSIGANLVSSEVKIEENLVIEVTITANEDGAYIISAEQYDSWAELESIEPQILNLKSGETGTATLTFVPQESGDQSFRVKTLYGDDEATKTISVNVPEKTGFFTGAFAGFGDNSNTALYLIIAIVVVLVLIIITLLVKGSRRKPNPEF